MKPRIPVSVGVATTTVLVVAGAVTGLLEARIAFSVLIGLPTGILAGAIVATATARIYGTRSQSVRAALEGTAAVGPTFLALAGVRYAIAATRGVLSTTTAIAVALLVGVVVAVLRGRSSE
ncbi:hypothetical protein SAMN05192561_11330 [Halopenitus malekzadehii]|uniref:DUF8147 domain-containing protein n=1 Tax=Halopenitus malekzadehii TaxID=1267564 RepID=A0A1H6JH80_9EURY|nr:hypothetical protein [Halopenitus malekzadehii]SEH61674.1 hypothetical protein SAMN05192561_11330 [Halopenitus malekzadehii]